MKQGTPKTLAEAIRNAGASPKETELHVKDYLAQHFGAAMLISDDETALILKKLFERITKGGA